MMQKENYNKTAQSLLEKNHEQSKIHSSAGEKLKRRHHRSKHPTEIVAFKCMDGRLNLSVFTQTPVGIIQPFRTMGGIFDLGDERLGKIVQDSVEYAIDKRRRYMPLCTYHFSKGNTHRGCAGHKYNTEAAVLGAKRLVEQFRFTFCDLGSGSGYGQEVYPILVGIETDHESLQFHSADGKLFSVEAHLDDSEDDCRLGLREMFPDMANEMLEDLLRLVVGNQKHVKEVISQNRAPIDLEHRESTICFGRGFDWLHTPNKALIIGPFGNDLSDSIITAGNLLVKNVKEGRVDPSNGLAIMTAGLYYDEGMNKNRIKLKSYDLYRYIKNVLEKNVPELFKVCNIQYLVGVTSHDTRAFTEIDVADFERRFDGRFELSEDEKVGILVKSESEVIA